MNKSGEMMTILQQVQERVERLERDAEVWATVLLVKEPQTLRAAEAYEGLRRQILAATAERMTHLSQLASMAVAVARATSVDDLRPQVEEWLRQASVVEIQEVPQGARPSDVFEDIDGGALDDGRAFNALEPAYVDAHTGRVLRLGRVQCMPVEEPSPERTPVSSRESTRPEPLGSRRQQRSDDETSTNLPSPGE